MGKFEKAIESLVDLLKEIQTEEKNKILLFDIPALSEGIEKVLRRLRLGEENVWESAGDLFI